MRKDGHVSNRSDHAAACPQVFREFPAPPKAAAAPKKSKSKKKEVVEEVQKGLAQNHRVEGYRYCP